MTDELRAALDALSPEERRRFSRAATLAIVELLDELKQEGGQLEGDTAQRRTLDDPAPQVAI